MLNVLTRDNVRAFDPRNRRSVMDIQGGGSPDVSGRKTDRGGDVRSDYLQAPGAASTSPRDLGGTPAIAPAPTALGDPLTTFDSATLLGDRRAAGEDDVLSVTPPPPVTLPVDTGQPGAALPPPQDGTPAPPPARDDPAVPGNPGAGSTPTNPPGTNHPAAPPPPAEPGTPPPTSHPAAPPPVAPGQPPVGGGAPQPPAEPAPTPESVPTGLAALADMLVARLNQPNPYQDDEVAAIRAEGAADLANKRTQGVENVRSDASKRGVFYGTPLTTGMGQVETDMAREAATFENDLVERIVQAREQRSTQTIQQALGFLGLAQNETQARNQLAIAAASLAQASGIDPNSALALLMGMEGGSGAGMSAELAAFLGNLFQGEGT